MGIGLPLLLFVALAWRMIPEADLLLQEFITLYARFYSRLRSGSEMTQALSERLRDPNTLNTLFGDGDGVGAINAFLQTTQSVGAVAGQMLIAVAVSIYWTADQVRFERVWLSLLSPQRRGVARTQWRAIEAGVGAYLRSELAQSIAAGAILALGYWLLGVPYPSVLALVAALAWLIPLAGGLLGVAAVIVLTWSLGPVTVIAAAALTTAVYLLMEMVVEPRLYTRTRYWRVLVLLIMLAMTDAFGILGLIISPPLATALQILIDGMLLRPTPLPAPTVTSVVDLSGVHAELESTRSLIEDESAPLSPRIADLFGRLQALVREAEQIQDKEPAA